MYLFERIVRAVIYLGVVLMVPVHAHGVVPPPNPPAEMQFMFFRDTGASVRTCVQKAVEGHASCNAAAQARNAAGSVAIGGVQSSAPGGDRAAAGALGGAGQSGASVDYQEFEKCESARAQCVAACSAAKRNLEGTQGRLSQARAAAGQDADLQAKLNNDEAAIATGMNEVESKSAYCTQVFGARAASARTSFAGNVEMTRQAAAFSRSLTAGSSTSSGLGMSDILGYAAVGGAGVGAGYLLFGNNDDKKERKNAARAACLAPHIFDEASGQCRGCGEGFTYNAEKRACETTAAKDGGGTGDQAASGEDKNCTNPSNVSSDSCRNHYIGVCSSNASAQGCSDFDKAFCQGSASAQGDGQTTGGPGAGSAYCTLHEARRYCSGGANNGAPACNWVMSRGPACSNNPASAACLPHYASQEAFRQSCSAFSSDPLCKSSLATMIGSAPPPSDNNVSAQTLSRGFDSGSGSATRTISGTQGGGTAGTGGASFTVSSAPDISPRFGANLFEKSSSSIRELCASGGLVDCRAR